MNKLTIRVQKYLFVLLGVFIPTSIAVTNILIGALVVCWLAEGKMATKLKLIKSSKWMLAIFSLIGFYVLGMLWGEIHLNAEWQFQRLALLLVFPILATIELDQKTVEYGATAFLITTFISALLAILINNKLVSPLGSFLPLINDSFEISAFIKYNYHNVLLALSVILCAYLIFENKTRHKNIAIIFVIVYAVSIFTEPGRAGQLLFNLSAVFYIFYYNSSKIFRCLALLLLLFSFQFLVYKTTKVYKNRFDTVSKIIKNNGYKSQGSVEDFRYLVFRETLNKTIKKPFLGYGTGSFGTIFKNEIQNSGHYFDKHTTPHNQYLYVWFELGILGLALLMLIFYYQVVDLFKKENGIHRVLLPVSFILLMFIDSYFFIFIVTISYIYLYTIYSRYKLE